MAVTRIKNNQITDATITYAKIANGTLVGANFNADLTLNSNVSIIGNLSVTGATSTVSSTNTYVNDPLVVFNNGYTGSLSGYDIGILVNRNLSALSGYGSVNTAWVWSEADAAFVAIATTNTGGGITAINNSGFANVKVGNLTANSVTITTGSLSVPSINSQFTGNGAFTYDTATNFSSGNAQISGGNGVFTTATATNFSSGNAQISGGNGVFTTATSTNFSTGNAVISGGNGAFTTLTATNFSSANISNSNGAFTTLTATNFSTGNASISGGNSAFTTATATNFSTANASISGGNGAFTTLTATNLSSGNIVGVLTGTASTSNVALYVKETATTTNASYYVHLSDASITGNTAVYVGSGLTFNPSTNNLATTTFTGTFSGTASITSGSITGVNAAVTTLVATNFSSGNAQISGGNGVFTTATATNFSSGNAQISGGNGALTTLVTTNFGSGNAVITGGSLNGTTVGATTAATGRFTTITGTSTTDATSTTSGALQIAGGVGIVGNLWVGGNIYAANIIGTTSSIITIQDSLVYLQAPNPYGTYNYDIGFYSDYTNQYYGHSGLARKQTANAWVLFANVQSEPTATGINWSDAGLAYDSLIAGNIVSANTTASTSTTTGALIVAGGAGIAGTVYAGNFNTSGGSVLGTATATNFSTGNASISGGNGAFTTLTATNFSSGNIVGVLTGTASTANVSLYDSLTATSTNASYYFQITDRSTTGNAGTFVGSGATFNPSTNTLTTTSFSGTNAAFTTTVSTNFSSGNAQITGGNGAFTTLTSTNFSTANASISGGNGAFTTLSATNFSSGNARISTGYADAFPIGANTAATGAFTTLSTSGVTTHAGNVVVTSGVDTTSNTTGALVLTGTGGLSVGGNAYVGNNLYIGPTSFSKTLTTPTIIAVDSGSTYAQLAMINSAGSGSADFAAYADNGTDSGGWVDMGVAGSTFSDANYTITRPQDGYIITRPLSNTYGGNLVIGTSEAGSYNDVVIGVGSFLAASEVARFHGNASNSGTFVLKLPTNAVPAANTGAMQVWGGASIGSNAYVGGATTFGGSRTAGGDHIVQGKNDATLIWAKSGASYDQVLIGNSATMSTLITGAKLQINSTDSILLPTGTNAQRPGSAGGTDTQGMFRYNTTSNAIEWYTGSTWQAASSSFTVIADQQFNGDGTSVAFTLTESQTTNSCIVSINGVVQIPTLAYSVFSGNLNLVFTEAPASGDVIDVRKLTTTQTVTNLASSNGYDVISVDNTAGIQFYTGAAAQTLQYTLDTSGAWVTQRANVAVASANTETAIDSFAKATYRSAKYVIQATSSGKYQVMEALVVHDDTTPQIAPYGIVQTNGNVGVLTATISGGTVSVNFVAANANTNVRVSKEYFII